MEQLTVDHAKKLRRTTRCLVTKLVHKVSGRLKKEPDEIDQRKLRQFLVDLKEKSTELKKLDKVIVDTYFDTDADEDTCDNEAEEAKAIQDRISYSVMSVDHMLAELSKEENLSVCSGTVRRVGSKESLISMKSRSTVRTATSSDSKTSVTTRISSKASVGTAGSTENSGGNDQQRVRVKLPKLEMHKFTGQVEDWQEFWDSFRSAVHGDLGIAKINKFKYLRSYLEEPARRVNAGLTLTDADYDAAAEILEKLVRKACIHQKSSHQSVAESCPGVY